MKKIFYLFFSFIFIQCYTAQYKTDFISTPFKLDFSQGTWMINEIQCTGCSKDNLHHIAYKGFLKKLDSRLKGVHEVDPSLLFAIPLDKDPLPLQIIQKESDYDYLINISQVETKDEINSIELLGGQEGLNNNAAVILEIYDLKTLEKIYYRKVSGTMESEEHDEDFRLAKGANAIAAKCLTNIMKKVLE